MKIEKTHAELTRIEVTLNKYDLEKFVRTQAAIPPDLYYSEMTVDDGYETDRCGDSVKKRDASVSLLFSRTKPQPDRTEVEERAASGNPAAECAHPFVVRDEENGGSSCQQCGRSFVPAAPTADAATKG